MGSPRPWMPPWDCPQDAIGSPNQVTSGGPGLGGNSKVHVTPKQQDWGTSYSINKVQHPYYCRQPHPNPSCCSAAQEQHPQGRPSTHGQLMLIHTGPPITASFTPLEEASAPVCR